MLWGRLEQILDPGGPRHPSEGSSYPILVAAAVGARIPGGAGQAGRQGRRLALREPSCRPAEESLCGRLRAEDPRPELDDVEVELQDPPLGELSLELPGEQGLLDLPPRVAGRRQPEILDQLLAQGGGAA